MSKFQGLPETPMTLVFLPPIQSISVQYLWVLWSQLPSPRVHYSHPLLTHLPVSRLTNYTSRQKNSFPLFLELTAIIIIYQALICYTLVMYSLIQSSNQP